MVLRDTDLPAEFLCPPIERTPSGETSVDLDPVRSAIVEPNFFIHGLVVSHEHTGRGELEEAKGRGDSSLCPQFEQHLIEGHILCSGKASGV
jgi:hypothetical protein